MRYFATHRQAWIYGRRIAQPGGRAFTVMQVEAGLWRGYWFAMPA